MIYKHFVLTRFNIPFIKDRGCEFLLSKDYLDNRFDIFYRFCAQSIINQSCKNYTWFILFDANTPIEYKEKYNIFLSSYPNIIPVYIDLQELNAQDVIEYYPQEAIRYAALARNGYKADKLSELHYEDLVSRILLPQYLNNLFQKYIDSETEYIITTRIDNDDCFEVDMIKTVQGQVIKANIDKILNFDNGLQYIADKNICQTFFYPNNHFTSIIEPVNCPIKTILYWDHYFIDRYKEVIHIDTKPLWMEVIHDNNVVNSLKLGQENRLIWNVDLQPFGINKRWNYLATIAALLIDPKAYVWPRIKKALHLSKLKRLFKCHLS